MCEPFDFALDKLREAISNRKITFSVYNTEDCRGLRPGNDGFWSFLQNTNLKKNKVGLQPEIRNTKPYIRNHT